MIGRTISHYRIIEKLGAGGMGAVYRATDDRLKRDVAIKVLLESYASDPALMQRFEQEAQAVGKLNHPNILAVYDFGIQDGSPYLVTELLQGESLRARLEAGVLPQSRALDVALQMAQGLAAAHAAGIVHRDLKPENVFLTKDGRVKILDFGVAKVEPALTGETDATRANLTKPGTVFGTVGYMSPEQVRGQSVDCRSDIFSFGCVLHEMLTGEKAFKRGSVADTISAILNLDRQQPTQPVITSPALDRIVEHCLEKDPGTRFQSAQDLAFALASVSLGTHASGLLVAQPSGETIPSPRTLSRWRSAQIAVGMAVILAVAAAASFFAGRLSAPSTQPRYQRLTYRRGTVEAARFAPDGHSIVYSATWESEPTEVFTVRLESPESRSLGFPAAALLGISGKGELALLERRSGGRSVFFQQGMLARVPFAGGLPRPVQERITFADWSPDGQELLVVRETETVVQLEYPPGRVLYQSGGSIAYPRLSPSGDRIAFIDRPLTYDTTGTIATVDTAGKMQTHTRKYGSVKGLAWTPSGKEIWFTAAEGGARQDLYAVTPAGRQRLVLRSTTSITLHDIAPDGRVLLSNDAIRMRMFGRSPGDSRDRELSWLDWSMPTQLSADGRIVVFGESGEGASPPAIYIRETNGAPAQRLGPGGLARLSPDHKWVVAVGADFPGLLLHPVGPGTTRQIPLKDISASMAGILPDGNRVWFVGNEPSRGSRLYLTTVDGGKPLPISPEGTQTVPPDATPDGNYIVAESGGRTYLYPAAGGEPQPVTGLEAGERTTGWSPDVQSFLTYQRGQLPVKVYRVDRRTGRRSFVLELSLSDPAGLSFGGIFLDMTPDGKSYVYSKGETLSELQLVSGLQ